MQPDNVDNLKVQKYATIRIVLKKFYLFFLSINKKQCLFT